MSGHTDPPPPINAGTSGTATTPGTGVIGQGQQGQLLAGQQSQALSTMGQSTPFGALSYSTSIDPITGLPKYQANTQYSPIEQAIFNLMQGQQVGAGAAGLGNEANNFARYSQDPTQQLLAQTGSLTSNFVNSMNPAWERFMAPQRDQLDNHLRNQGIMPGTPAYQQQMDALTQQQLLTKGGALAQFQPQAFGEASQALNMPLGWEQQFMGMSQPGSLPGSLINTPQGNVQPTDVTGVNIEQQNEQFRNYQQQQAAHNNLMSMIFGVPAAAAGLRTAGGSSVGGDLLSSAGSGISSLFGPGASSMGPLSLALF